jgi:hypothetical protein
MSIKMFLFVVTKILILSLLLFVLFLLQSLREVAVLMSYLNHTPPLGKGLKVEGRVGGWVEVEGSPLGPKVKAPCLAPH